MVVAYVKQETIEPIKGLGRYVGLGLAGSGLLGLGLITVFLGLLRLLQTETGSAFDGNWSWVPYVITLVACGIMTFAAFKATTSRKEKA
ncbi:MAG: hypothetical protein ACRD12_23405 [Acidimicrobiales bacterium]